MTMASEDTGGTTSPPTTPPSQLSRLKKRVSEHNLRLDIEGANNRARTTSETLHVLEPDCMFASPECRTRTGEKSCRCDTDIEEEGKELFTNFVKEEIERAGLIDKASTVSIVQTPFGYQNPVWAKAGKELREMADAFSRTKERNKVKNKACSLSVAQMTYGKFKDLISELFLNSGITPERIVVLFLFCSDLALNNLEHSAVDLFQRCMTWTWSFITEKICCWVKEHGGWRAVLGESVQFVGGTKVLGIVALVGILATAYHIMKR